MRSILLLFMLAILVGCSGGKSETKNAKSGKPSAIEALGGITPPEDTPWTEMSYEEKEWYMIGKVLPITKELFQNFDGAKFADFGCDTCHGKDGDAVKYRMPVADLPPMPRVGTLQYNQIKAMAPEMMKFMEDEITPAVQVMLGLDVHDPAAKTGFGCAGCHNVAGESANRGASNLARLD